MKTETQEAMAKVRRDMPDDLEVAVELSIRIHRNGAMSIKGPIADAAFCFKMLDEARDTIKRNQKPDKPLLIVPGQDLDSKAKEAYGK